MTLRGVFVAGTDTGVGKTWVSCGLAAAAARAGRRIEVMKPVAAGAVATPDGLRNDDALALIAAAGSRARYEDVNPYCLPQPVSPHIAAAAAGVRIEVEVLCDAARRLAAGDNWLLVEGAGGWHAPIGAHATMAEVARTLGLPVLLVVGLRLGCLNHAVLTQAAIERDGCRFAGWIGNVIDPAMPALEANVDWLRKRLGEPFALAPHRGPAEATTHASGGLPDECFTSASRRLMQL